jgi:hypothetical protein
LQIRKDVTTRSLHDVAWGAAQRLQRAMRLARELEGLLDEHLGERDEGGDFHVRLARAQALGVVDLLAEVVRRSSNDPSDPLPLL